ncbi:transporter [Aquabacterium sp.]|uniref:transporter n=1 Tax=Aquabacterium sp. TaxID=1872578 RepID=UPI0019C5EF91|nr:transporter [Aquabacterium sp.]MBC7699624.1 transporter [Aquabacterium sp.]
MAAHHFTLIATTLAAGLLLPLAAHAEEAVMATDRPDIVESSAVVGLGRFQIETSFASESNTVAGVKTTTRTTPTLLRYGITENTELRLETDGFIRDGQDNGFADVALGLKWHTHDGDEATGKPAIAWLFHADLDSGARAFRGQGVRPSVRVVAEWELPHDMALGIMPGVLADKNDAGEHFVAGIFAVTVGKSWTDGFRTFIEVAGQQLSSRKNGGAVVTYDAGMAYMLSPAMQLDAAVSIGANQYTPDRLWTVGFSVKF